MKLHYIPLLAITCALCSEPTQTVLLESQDKTNSVVYIYPFVGLFQSISKENEMYSLAISEWGGDPELVGVIGTIDVKKLIQSIHSIQVERSKMVIFGEAYSEEKFRDLVRLQSMTDQEGNRIFDIDIEGKYYLLEPDQFRRIHTKEELLKILKEKWQITNFAPQPPQEYFEYLKKKAQPSGAINSEAAASTR